MKVYIICSGEYSDKVIDFVTLDKDKAEELRKIAEYNDWYGNAWIDERETDESDEAVKRGIKYTYCVTFSHNSYTIEKLGYTECEDLFEGEDGSIEVLVNAKNEDEALKIAADRRAKFIAEEEGLT